VFGTQQSTISDRNHARHRDRLRHRDADRPVSGRAVAARGDARGPVRRLGNIGYMGPGLALAVLGAKAAAPTALIFCCDSIFLFSMVPLLIELSDRDHPSMLHAFGVVRQIVSNPLIMSAGIGALVAALHVHLPVALDNMILFLQNAAAPTALF